MGKKCDLSDFGHGMIVGDLSLSETAAPCTTVSRAVVSNHVPWRAESMQVFTPTNHYTS